MTRIARFAPVALLLALAGCGSPDNKYFTLSTEGWTAPVSTAARTVSVDEVTIPSYLDRPQIVIRKDATQADIREYEIPRADNKETGVFAVSNGDRRFTRYGYADLYQQGSGFEVLYRLWPGTQHHLLWGDPAQASGFGHTATVS